MEEVDILSQGSVLEPLNTLVVTENKSDAAKLLDNNWNFVKKELLSIPNNSSSKLQKVRNLSPLIAFESIFSDSFWNIILVIFII